MLKARKKRRLSRQPARSPESHISRLSKTPRPARKSSSRSRRQGRAVLSAGIKMLRHGIVPSTRRTAASIAISKPAKPLLKALLENVVRVVKEPVYKGVVYFVLERFELLLLGMTLVQVDDAGIYVVIRPHGIAVMFVEE